MPFALLSSRHRATSQSLLLRRGGPLLLLALAALIVVVATNFLRAGQAINRIERQNQINKEIPYLRALLFDVISAESGQRAYLLTGRASYLDPYHQALGRHRQRLSALLASPGLTATERGDLEQVKAFLELKFDELAMTIALHQQGEFAAARNLVLTDHDRSYTQLLQALLEKITQEHVAERDAIAQELSVAARRTRELTVVGMTLLLLFAVLALWQLKQVLGENARLVQQLEQEAAHCPLTGLYNRRSFDEQLRHEIALAQRSGHAVAVLFLDLDGFKQVNDQHGHDVGDRLLQELAQALNKTVRAADLVFRLAGDEFAILATEQANDDHHLTVLAERLNRSVLELARQPQWHSVKLGVSIGIAVYPRDAESPESLLEAADQAMYRAKASGKGRTQFAVPSIDGMA